MAQEISNRLNNIRGTKQVPRRAWSLVRWTFHMSQIQNWVSIENCLLRYPLFCFNISEKKALSPRQQAPSGCWFFDLLQVIWKADLCKRLGIPVILWAAEEKTARQTLCKEIFPYIKIRSDCHLDKGSWPVEILSATPYLFSTETFPYTPYSTFLSNVTVCLASFYSTKSAVINRKSFGHLCH